MNKVRVLIVDDEPEAGEILSLRLKRRGLEPFYMPDGEKALDFLRIQPVEIVLLDIKMPGMGGLEVLTHISRDYPGIATIIISGHADMEAVAKGLELGAFSYLLKPVDFDVLCHKIEDACRQKSLDFAPV